MFARGGEGLEVSGLSCVIGCAAGGTLLMPHLLIFERSGGIMSLWVVVTMVLLQEEPQPVAGARQRPGGVTTAQPQRVRFYLLFFSTACALVVITV